MELSEWLEQKGFTDNNGYFTIMYEICLVLRINKN